MIAVVQRVLNASVTVEVPPHCESIQDGLCIFLGIETGDDSSQAKWMAKKLSNLRLFKDENEKMNLSLQDIGGELLLISQFTLAGDCSKGNRPSYINAAQPEIAEPLVELVRDFLQTEHKIAVKTGVFGAMMKIELTNDGPVTLIVQRD
ncbi:MAG TPA: D-tyrosyl-tRNA(Tyr) deacylase [Phycisphaerales bacterium]|jgi:D-tyrosyl-tRNA(Tyr) deacylase|nr:D-tyrosyl-tRNA(Tyr) deacylase [Phycisphaerales bacterium]HIB50471.1 D-tyrosyl-tRNA(Tyr) deacylase [Phycisphaerales bacterium]HIN84653.1 D-tyrosyl-tRNA(Tyr) deacylase [Phycisphaerales bacterium]HIO20468.1 D-tyrosyl-tRNA(Tyr) deacylase [Phycisphaerales bacterium]HIO53244.1 D-tyrosyl-tRNA(Tyr) deacylase [Phycisphaerales bacterium]